MLPYGAPEDAIQENQAENQVQQVGDDHNDVIKLLVWTHFYLMGDESCDRQRGISNREECIHDHCPRSFAQHSLM